MHPLFRRIQPCAEDIFCHVKSITDGDALEQGSTVEFTKNWDNTRGKFRAENVKGGITGGPAYGGGSSFLGGGGGQEVRPGDWVCPRDDCSEHNFASRDVCRKCPEEKPADGGRMPEQRGGGGGGGGGRGYDRYDDRRGGGGRDRYDDRRGGYDDR